MSNTNRAACLATWPFGFNAIKAYVDCLRQGGSALDAVENIISDVEEDPALGVYIVGRGGFANSEGILQCDAAIMDGRQCQFGAVCALEGVGSPIRVARRVKDDCPHNMLVGQGAQDFARNQGFTIQPDIEVICEPTPSNVPGAVNQTSSHDTLGVIALDKDGNIACGVSSSGKPGKLPGRVGDSPLPGCGLYADNSVGAACCTGDGDEILRFCPSFLVVENMRHGMSPKQACEEALCRITKILGAKKSVEISIIAMNMKGECGAASNISHWEDILSKQIFKGFPCVQWKEHDHNVNIECFPALK